MCVQWPITVAHCMLCTRRLLYYSRQLINPYVPPRCPQFCISLWQRQIQEQASFLSLSRPETEIERKILSPTWWDRLIRMDYPFLVATCRAKRQCHSALCEGECVWCALSLEDIQPLHTDTSPQISKGANITPWAIRGNDPFYAFWGPFGVSWGIVSKPPTGSWRPHYGGHDKRLSAACRQSCHIQFWPFSTI